MRNDINSHLDFVSQAAANSGDTNNVALIVQIKHKLAQIPENLFAGATRLKDEFEHKTPAQVEQDVAVEKQEALHPLANETVAAPVHDVVAEPALPPLWSE